MAVKKSAEESRALSQATTAAAGRGFMTSVTTLVSRMIMARAWLLLECRRLVRFARRRPEVEAPRGPEGLQEEVAKLAWRSDGPCQDAGGLPFHGDSVAGGPILQALVGLVVELANGQVGHISTSLRCATERM